MEILTAVLFLLIVYVIFWEFYPYKFLKLEDKNLTTYVKPHQNINKYKVIAHIHTQFSFDSLGKPSDIKKAMEENDIDFVFITDHNNDDYKYFENDRVFAGIEINTESGRLLKLGNKLPVISHPNNFEFEHYKWKG
ncbi:PHP domain-containing protein, partial [Hydrogenivirga sp. 128-5-R1-1]|uniref:PHP domain-containing protein n=1 Tax=Hydrogenivirga sp. 128-5-R1-1 TaxID=392423 RepID=UPI00015F35B8